MKCAEPYRAMIRESLAEYRRWAERAEQAEDLEAIKGALNASFLTRVHLLDIIADAERETRAMAERNIGQAA